MLAEKLSGSSVTCATIRKMKSKFVALTYLVSFSAFPVLAEETALIWPGKGVGKICLGDTYAQVHKKCGCPTSSLKCKDRLISEYYNSAKATQLVNAGKIKVLYRGKQVVQIHVRSLRFKTPSGISTATRLSRSPVKSRFKWHESVYSYPEEGDPLGQMNRNTYYDDVKHGFSLEMGLYEGGVGLDRTPEVIIIHKAGVPVIIEAGGSFLR